MVDSVDGVTSGFEGEIELIGSLTETALGSGVVNASEGGGVTEDGLDLVCEG